MFLNKDFPYIESFRNHFIIASLLGAFVSFIVIFLQPYGAGLNDFPYKTLYFIGYGIINFLMYLVMFFLFNVFYRKTKKWKWAEELFFDICFVFLMIFIAEFYTEFFINKNPSRLNLTYVIGWYKTVFPGFGILMITITILLRYYFGKENITNIEINEVNNKKKNTSKITIHSSLKNESLVVSKESIVFIKSEDNYIYIYFLKNDLLTNKILRNTLKDTHKQLPFLIKTHRSFLVNPQHISKLKGNSQNAKIYFKDFQETVPVSKTFYNTIKKTI